eukprot:scaffold588_cov389-Prasinococcus_capsulatus_cf.AAC.4
MLQALPSYEPPRAWSEVRAVHDCHANLLAQVAPYCRRSTVLHALVPCASAAHHILTGVFHGPSLRACDR